MLKMVLGQAALYGLFVAAIGFFSGHPTYQHLPPDQALLKLSFAYHGKVIADCRERTPEELAKLQPNMRTARSCGRERSPILVEMDLDGKPLVRETVQPAGLGKDGSADVYRRFPIPAGEHLLAVRINDNARVREFTFTREEKVTLAPAQVIVVDLYSDKGIVFQ